MIRENRLRFNRNNQQGLTLISLLISSAILVVLSTFIAVVLIDISQFDLRSRAKTASVSNGRFALSKIEQDIRSSSAIIEPAAGEISDRLVISGEVDIEYSLQNNAIKRGYDVSYEPTTTYLYLDNLTSNQVRVIDFQVEQVKETAEVNHSTVKISLTVEWIGRLKADQPKETSYQTTVSLRE